MKTRLPTLIVPHLTLILVLASACDTDPDPSAIEERLVELGIDDDDLLAEVSAQLTHAQIDILEVQLDDAQQSDPDQLGLAPQNQASGSCSAAFVAVGYEENDGFATWFENLEFGVSEQDKAWESFRCQLYCTNVNVCDKDTAVYFFEKLGRSGQTGIHNCLCLDG